MECPRALLRYAGSPRLPAVESRENVQAWVDESVRSPSPAYSAGAYFLAAALADLADADRLRAALRGLRAGKNVRIHWRLENPARHPKLANAVTSLDGVENLIVIGTPVDPKRAERARRYCMQRLIHELSLRGVRSIHLERRQTKLNTKDAYLFDALRSSGVLAPATTITFEHPNNEPLLWLPDITAGAFAAFQQNPANPAFANLARLIESVTIEVP